MCGEVIGMEVSPTPEARLCVAPLRSKAGNAAPMGVSAWTLGAVAWQSRNYSCCEIGRDLYGTGEES